MPTGQEIREVLIATWRLLTFRSVRFDMQRLGNVYLGVGLISAWIVGIGRYWDNPRAQLWQYLGLGSVAYVFVLSFFLWVFLMPLRPKNWNYQSVLTFVSLTSPPAIRPRSSFRPMTFERDSFKGECST